MDNYEIFIVTLFILFIVFIIWIKSWNKKNINNGEHDEFYENGNLKKQIRILSNLKGIIQEKYYYENGNLEFECYKKNELLNGEAKIFNEDGRLTLTKMYKKGLRDGWINYYDNGTCIQKQFYKKDLFYENIDSSKPFTGIKKIQYLDGSYLEINFLKGKYHGVVKDVSKDGKLIGEFIYKKDNLVDRKIYDENGEIIDEVVTVLNIKAILTTIAIILLGILAIYFG